MNVYNTLHIASQRTGRFVYFDKKCAFPGTITSTESKTRNQKNWSVDNIAAVTLPNVASYESYNSYSSPSSFISLAKLAFGLPVSISKVTPGLLGLPLLSGRLSRHSPTAMILRSGKGGEVISDMYEELRDSTSDSEPMV